MKSRFRIPRVLQKYCDGQTEFDIKGESVGEMLTVVKQDYPSVYNCICDETGKVRRHINLFLNDELLVGPNAFDVKVASSDVVSVFQAVSGG